MVPDATNAKSRFAGENCARTWRTRDGDAIRRARSRAVAALRQTYENIRRRTRTVTPVETQRNRAAGRRRGTVAEMDCCEWPAGLFRFARRLGLVRDRRTCGREARMPASGPRLLMPRQRRPVYGLA